MIWLILLVAIWIIMQVITFGVILNYFQRFFQHIAIECIRDDIWFAIGVSFLWPVSLIIFILDYWHSDVKIGLMFWPPNYHNKLRLMESLGGNNNF